MSQNAPDDPGVQAKCPSCEKTFKLVFGEYGFETRVDPPVTLEAHSCLSGGVYAITVRCPHCKEEERIL